MTRDEARAMLKNCNSRPAKLLAFSYVSLTEKELLVMQLRYIHGLTQEETISRLPYCYAQLLNIPPGGGHRKVHPVPEQRAELGTAGPEQVCRHLEGYRVFRAASKDNQTNTILKKRPLSKIKEGGLFSCSFLALYMWFSWPKYRAVLCVCLV